MVNIDDDYDLYACLENNHQPFAVDDIERVLAIVEGEHEGPSWWWLLRLTGDRIALLSGTCDYTGWDCQSWADSVIIDAVGDGPWAAHAMSAYTAYWEAGPADYEDHSEELAILSQQETSGLAPTRRMIVGRELFRDDPA